jgi:mRNA interferase RelE/StbE
VAYRVEVSKAAQKNWDAVDAAMRKRFKSRLEELGKNPFEKSKPLVNKKPPQRSSRLGDWRILFQVDVEAKVVVVVGIEPRGSAYS